MVYRLEEIWVQVPVLYEEHSHLRDNWALVARTICIMLEKTGLTDKV
jgi:hypothetical protein